MVRIETDTDLTYRVPGVFQVKLKNRMAGINANLDDLQAGIEAGSRAAGTLHTDTSRFNGFLETPLLRDIARHVKELQACVLDQRAAMLELRDGVLRLQEELTRSNGAVRPPPVPETDRPRS